MGRNHSSSTGSSLMKDSDRRIRTVRIDVPLRSTCSYLFVDAKQEEWDPWWASLYEYLLSLGGDSLEWRYEPVQNVHVAQPELTNEQRTALARFLRTAPAQQVAEHRTLRRAVELTADREKELELMFFSEGTPEGPSVPEIA
jgi:hypothetical protein